MRKETIILVGLGDLTKIRVRCGHCTYDVTIPIETTANTPVHCPGCEQFWNPADGSDSTTPNFIDRFVKALAALEAKTPKPDANTPDANRFRVELVLSEPE